MKVSRFRRRFSGSSLRVRIPAASYSASVNICLRTQSNCEYRPADDGRNDSFEAAAVEREFGFQDRPLMIHDRSFPGGYRVQRARGLGRRHLSNMLKTLAHPLHPQRGIGIEDDIFRAIVGQELKHRLAQFPLQFSFQAVVLLIVSNSEHPS